MTFVDRYRAVGLERNPFSTQALTETAVFVDRGLDAPPPPGSRTMVQIIGARGYGKSTHLRHWHSLQPGPHHYIPLEPYRKRWAAPPAAISTDRVVFYGDEIDRMPALLRRSWFRQLASASATMVIGTHVDLAPIGRSAGFTVITHFLQPFTHSEMQSLITQRLRVGALDGEPQIALGDTQLDTLFAESGGVPREVEELSHRLLADRLG